MDRGLKEFEVAEFDEERAAIVEIDGRMTREEAEYRARHHAVERTRRLPDKT
jgi:hypothetical protein